MVMRGSVREREECLVGWLVGRSFPSSGRASFHYSKSLSTGGRCSRCVKGSSVDCGVLCLLWLVLGRFACVGF